MLGSGRQGLLIFRDGVGIALVVDGEGDEVDPDPEQHERTSPDQFRRRTGLESVVGRREGVGDAEDRAGDDDSLKIGEDEEPEGVGVVEAALDHVGDDRADRDVSPGGESLY